MKTRLRFFLAFVFILFVIFPSIYGEIHNPKPNPNPFKEGEIIEFMTDYSSYKKLELYIYNIKGDLIIKKQKTSNFGETMKWDGKNSYGYSVSKGPYFYILKITHEDGTQTKTDSIKGTIVYIK